MIRILCANWNHQDDAELERQHFPGVAFELCRSAIGASASIPLDLAQAADAVINYELPRSPKDYIHRIGRTGRAENPGDAISLVSPEEEHHFRVILKKMGKSVVLMESHELNLKGY